MINARKEIKKHEKEHRLLGLETKYFQLQMDLAAYEANNDIEGAKQAKKLMDQCEKSYAAIEAMTVE